MTLAHATLTTGHVVHHRPVQWQSDAARTRCHELLAAALEGTGPLWEGWALHARLLDGPVMECHAVCDCHRVATASWWTAAPKSATAAMWQSLRDSAPARDLLPDALAPPWCAVTLHAAAVRWALRHRRNGVAGRR